MKFKEQIGLGGGLMLSDQLEAFRRASIFRKSLVCRWQLQLQIMRFELSNL